MIKLKHPFVNKCPDIDEFMLSDNETGVVQSINSFCGRINKLSEKYKNIIDQSKFKGDALELFVEFMIKENGSDNRIGIFDYKTISDSDDEDVGVDGSGIGANEFPATVQVKFRAGNYVLTANKDHLSNFVTSSVFDYNVRLEDTKNMLIVTTAMKVDENTREKMLKGKVRVINRDILRQMYDNRTEWWKRFYESIIESRAKQDKGKFNVLPLRKHQSEAIESILEDSNLRGKIVLPTGCGKTLVEADMVCGMISSMQQGEINEIPVILVNSSRILLCFQLFDEIFRRMMGYGIKARYVNFNSGNKDDKDYAEAMVREGWTYRKIISTTKPTEIVELHKQCVADNLPLVIFSTYHSAEKLGNALKKAAIPPHLTIHDEAHNLVSKNFSKVANITDHGNLFFTATEKITDSADDVGMNNEEVYEEMIYTKSAKELIDAGEMLAPYLHVIRSSNIKRIDTDYEMMFASIIEGFERHDQKIKEISYSASDIGAKILVVCRGQQDLNEMFKTKIAKTFHENYPDVHLFALSSEFGIYNDGEKFNAPVTNMKKHALLKRLKALKSSDRALILHVDMIGEGIDVSGITGVMPFRNCEESKLVQNIGRSTRLHPTDRKRFYAKEIDSLNKSTWIKPYSWIIIPSYMIESEGMESRFRQQVDKLRNEFGYIPQQHTVIDNVVGLSEDPLPDTDNDISKKKKWEKSGIEDFEHEFEVVSVIEKIIYEDNKSKRVSQVLDNLPVI